MPGVAWFENVCVLMYDVLCGSLSLTLLPKLKCLTMSSVVRNKVLKLCLLDYLCDPDNIFEN